MRGCVRALSRESGDVLSPHVYIYIYIFGKDYECIVMRSVCVCVCVVYRGVQRMANRCSILRETAKREKPSVLLVVMAARNKQPHPVPICDKCCR